MASYVDMYQQVFGCMPKIIYFSLEIFDVKNTFQTVLSHEDFLMKHTN